MKNREQQTRVKKLNLERETVRVHVRTGIKTGAAQPLFTVSIRNGTLTGTGMGDIDP